MSVITTVEAVPSRLRVFYAYFRSRPKGEDRARVEQMLSPEPLRQVGKGDDAEDDGTSRANVYVNSLREALNLGIVEEIDDGKLRPPEYEGLNVGTVDDQFISWIEPRLLLTEHATRYSQQKFGFALAWLLRQSPLEPIPFAKNVAPSIAREFGIDAQSFDLTSKERFQNLAYWARYLGYATIVQSRSVIADPTVAIRRLLPAVFRRGPELRVEEFFRELAVLVPVFEQGSVREELESQSQSPASQESTQRLSASTSLALRRLADAKVLELRELSDASVRILGLGDVQQRITHIVFRGELA